MKKMDKLRCFATTENPDMILLTETWTNDSVNDNFLKLQGYEIIAKNDWVDTVGGRGGGILVYARKEINCWREEGESGFNQSVSVNVKLDKTAEFALHVVYRSLNSSRQNDEDLCRWVESLKGENLIIDDLNFPGIQWEAGRTDARERLFHQACSNMFLEQLVTEATHRNGNRLDLVLTNRRERIKEVRMEGRLFTDTGRPNQGRRCRNFNRANYKEARAMIGAVNWSEDLGPMNVEEAWQKVKGTLTEVIENYVPWRKVQTKPRPKLYNREVEQNIKKKRNAWNRWKKSKKPEDKEEYQRLERETKGMIRRRKKGLEKSIAREAKKNPKAYYAYVNSGKNMRNKVGPLKLHENGETKVVTDPKT